MVSFSLHQSRGLGYVYICMSFQTGGSNHAYQNQIAHSSLPDWNGETSWKTSSARCLYQENHIIANKIIS